MSKVLEAYSPVVMAANSTRTKLKCKSVQQFTCTVSGTINVDDADGDVLVDMPVTAGVVYPLLYTVKDYATVVLSGGAAGTLGIA